MAITKYATKITTDSGITTVKHHQTDIVVYNANTDTITLNNGGYTSVSTKKRLNQALEMFGFNCRVYQQDFSWYIVNLNTDVAIDYENHITLNKNCEVI